MLNIQQGHYLLLRKSKRKYCDYLNISTAPERGAETKGLYKPEIKIKK